MEKDPYFIKLNTENRDYIQKIKELQFIIDKTTYRLLEVQALASLADKQKELSVDERNRNSNEIERLKGLLDENIKLNKLKVEKRFRDYESEEIAKRRTVIAKLEKEIQEVKYKGGKLQKPYFDLFKELKVYLEKKFEKLRKKNAKSADRISFINENIKALMPEVEKMEGIIENQKVSYNALLEQKDQMWLERKDLEMTQIGLEIYTRYLANSVDLQDFLKSIDFNNLKSWVDKNKDVSDTVKEFLDTFSEIKKYSKPQVSQIIL